MPNHVRAGADPDINKVLQACARWSDKAVHEIRQLQRAEKPLWVFADTEYVGDTLIAHFISPNAPARKALRSSPSSPKLNDVTNLQVLLPLDARKVNKGNATGQGTNLEPCIQASNHFQVGLSEGRAKHLVLASTHAIGLSADGTIDLVAREKPQ